ncbi:MAG: ABC transporter permease [Candidatus Kapaibacterium sp.]|nr:MAG: ABC transporter permease [Candidatus Kapabacteria bacterium]
MNTRSQAFQRFYRSTLAVVRKDLRSELKTRYTMNAVGMFVLTTVSVIAFSSAGEKITNGIAASLLWIVLFFSAMTGLQKAFVSEEERGTSLLLSLHAPSLAVYCGKLLFNILLTMLLYGLATLAFFVFINDVEIRSPLLFAGGFFLGSCATAAATTLISAIIAKANTKAALFPVLSFPALLPLILAGVETTYQALSGVAFAEARNNFQIIASYTVVVIAVSVMLFDFVWKE